MPTSITQEYKRFNVETDRLLSLVQEIGYIQPKHSKLICEIILLRLFYLVEESLKRVSAKLLCGATYLNSDRPVLLNHSANFNAAISDMKNYMRPRPRHNLRWTKAREIKLNLSYCMDSGEHLLTTIDNNGQFIDELRRIRNRVAHNNTKSRTDYQLIVLRYYGARLNHLTPGLLLLSQRRAPRLIEEYILKARIFMKTLMKG